MSIHATDECKTQDHAKWHHFFSDGEEQLHLLALSHDSVMGNKRQEIRFVWQILFLNGVDIFPPLSV